MADTTEQLVVVMKAQNEQLLAGINQANEALKSHGNAAGGLSTTLGNLKLSWLAVYAAMKEGLKIGEDVVKSAMAEQDSQSQLAARLRSTGGASGETMNSLEKLSEAMSNSTKFSKENTREAEAMVLSYDKIGKEIFPDVIHASANMATAMGVDMTKAAKMLGRALQEPANGLGALSRMGVVFSDHEKNLIKDMVEANNTAGAQAIILDKVKEKFGGAAIAAGDTFAGKLQRLTRMVDEVKESIGGAIINAFDPYVSRLLKCGERTNSFKDTLANATHVIVDSTVYAMDSIKQAFDSTVDWIETAWNKYLASYNLVTDVVSKGPAKAMETYKSSMTWIENQHKASTDKITRDAKNCADDLARLHKGLTGKYKADITDWGKNDKDYQATKTKNEEEFYDKEHELKLAYKNFNASMDTAVVQSFVDGCTAQKATLGSVMSSMADAIGGAIVKYLEQMAVVYLIAQDYVDAGLAAAGAVAAKLVFSGLAGDLKNAKKMAFGGVGVVDRPTMFMAGEAGPEAYSFRPLGTTSNDNSMSVGDIHVHINGNANEADVERGVMQAFYKIRDRMGLSARFA